jgi:hypothetical protein
MTTSLLLERDQFQQWKDNPLTRDFLRYLEDRQADLMMAWGRGMDCPVEMQAQAVLLGQLAAISWDDVVAQYHPDDEQPDIAKEDE